MAAINDPQLLLSEMNPRLNEGEYVYCTISDPGNINEDQILFSFKEEEGLSVILKKEYADELQLKYDFVAAWITLTVHSSLSAVGLTAAFSNALADAGISCNVVAATYHDHIFVDVKDSEKALSVLKKLQRTTSSVQGEELNKTAGILNQKSESLHEVVNPESEFIIRKSEISEGALNSGQQSEITLQPRSTSNLICVSCGTKLIDKHCHHCGEKVVSSDDFSLSKLIEQGIDIFTHLDSKLFKSLKALLFRPGLLAVEYIKGVRKPYMKPFQVFLLSNFFFFLFLSSADIFLVPSTWFFSDYYPGISEMAEEISLKKNISLQQLALVYDSKVVSNSKLFVISIVPILALGTLVTGFKKHPEYGKHVVHSLYILAFIMVYAVVISKFEDILPDSLPERPIKIIVSTGLMVYIFISLKRFLQQGIVLRILNTLLLTGIFIGSLITYRYAISWLTLKFFI